MTRPKDLEEGDGVIFARVTYKEAAWSPSVGDRGVVMDLMEDDWVSVKFDSRAGHYGFLRNELRKLPVMRSGI